MSTTESHTNTVQSSLLPPPSAEKRPVHDWGLKGYRPPTSDFMAAIRRRQPRAFMHNWQKETRLLALYCTDPDCTIYDLLAAFHLSRPEMRRMFAHYGIDYKARNHAQVVAARPRQQTAREVYEEHRRTCDPCAKGICVYASQLRRRAEAAERRAR